MSLSTRSYGFRETHPRPQDPKCFFICLQPPEKLLPPPTQECGSPPEWEARVEGRPVGPCSSELRKSCNCGECTPPTREPPRGCIRTPSSLRGQQSRVSTPCAFLCPEFILGFPAARGRAPPTLPAFRGALQGRTALELGALKCPSQEPLPGRADCLGVPPEPWSLRRRRLPGANLPRRRRRRPARGDGQAPGPR